MKHLSGSILIFILFPVLIPFTVKSQAVKKGNSIISLCYGFPNLNANIYNVLESHDDFLIKSVGPFHLKYEYMITNKIGLGVNINFVLFNGTWKEIHDSLDASNHLVDYIINYKVSTWNYNALLRLNYHFYTDNRIDVYVGIAAGYRKDKTTLTSTPDDPKFTFVPAIFVPFGFELSMGSRYMFTDKLGGYAEFGIGKSILQIGVCRKL